MVTYYLNFEKTKLEKYIFKRFTGIWLLKCFALLLKYRILWFSKIIWSKHKQKKLTWIRKKIQKKFSFTNILTAFSYFTHYFTGRILSVSVSDSFIFLPGEILYDAWKQKILLFLWKQKNTKQNKTKALWQELDSYLNLFKIFSKLYKKFREFLNLL